MRYDHCLSGVLISLVGATLLTGCRGSDKKGNADSAQHAPIPNRTAEVSGFDHPESARYDSTTDIFFVSNIGGDPGAKDNNGFISRVKPDGVIDSLHFIAGGRNGVTLNAPKGLAIRGDTLYVADIDAVRAFDKNTGAPLATIDLSSKKALFLNDITVGPDGALYITDTGIRMEHGTSTHPAGTDRVFRIAPDHSVTIALQTDMLSRPNGITWDDYNKRFVIVPLGGSSIFAWRVGDKEPTVIDHAPAEMDGVEALRDGRLLVTSWKDSSLSIREGNKETLIKGFPSPADIGVDVRRNHVAIPLLTKNRLAIWAIPAVQQ